MAVAVKVVVVLVVVPMVAEFSSTQCWSALPFILTTLTPFAIVFTSFFHQMCRKRLSVCFLLAVFLLYLKLQQGWL